MSDVKDSDMAWRAKALQHEDSDYGSIPNFYTSLKVGSWDKPYEVISTVANRSR